MTTASDMCMAAAMRARSPSNISVEEVMNAGVYTAETEEGVEQAVQTMCEHKIQRPRLVTETGKVGIWNWDIATDRISGRDSLYEIHGINRDEVMGIDSFPSLVHPEDRTRVTEALDESLKSNSPYALEFRVVKPDGEIGWIFTSGVVFHDGDKPTRLVVVTLDITDRKRAEAERDMALAREQELRRAAEAANHLKDEFIATMSHELRNPLNVILGYSEILLRTQEFRNSSQLAQMGEALRRNALAQSHLIRDLLDLSRLQSGKLTLSTETVSIVTAINNAVETVRAEAAAKQIEIQIEVPDGALFVEGDLLRIEQIIWNLLTNAVRFTPAPGRVLVRATGDGDEVVLSVTDTGQGIDGAFLPHVFEMFRQADVSTSPAQSGLGIGLALVRQFVDLHGGTVEVKSAGVGLGTCFTVRLPQSEPAGTLQDRGGNKMKIKEVMTPDAKATWITESLADAAKTMWENDCGILPIIKDGRKVVGMITDRDICMATAMRDRKPSAISVEEVMNRIVFAAEAEEDIEQALQTMREHKVRRLPVLNLEGELLGIVSMNDIVLKAKGNGKKPQIDYGDVVKTYQAICEHPLPMVLAAKAN